MKIRPLIFTILLSILSFGMNAQTYYPKKNGKYVEEISSGKTIGHLKDHLAIGLWTSYYPKKKGKPVVHEKWAYENGVLEGNYYQYSSEGTITESGSYTNGKKNGIWMNFNSNGQERSFVTYKNDSLDGDEIGYFENGKVSVKYVWKNGMEVSHEVWNEDGTQMSGEYFLNGKRNGKCWGNVSRTNQDTAKFSYCYYLNGKKNGEEQKVNTDGSFVISHWQNDTLNGLALTFDKNGNETQRGNWIDGKMNGKWIDTYPSGQFIYTWHTMSELSDSSALFYENKKLETSYVLLNRTTMKISLVNYDTSGIKVNSGIKYMNGKDSVWTYYYPDGKVKARLNFSDGKPNGSYTAYYPGGNKFFTTSCYNGEVNADIVVYDKKGRPIPMVGPKADSLLRPWFVPNSEVHDPKLEKQVVNVIDEKLDTIYSIVEQLPTFPGEKNALMKWLQSNLKYPAMERDANIQGKVYIQFVVEKDGSVTNVKVKKSSGSSGLDKEAIRVVSMMPKWNPGMLGGKAVRTSFLLPVNFKIN